MGPRAIFSTCDPTTPNSLSIFVEHRTRQLHIHFTSFSTLSRTRKTAIFRMRVKGGSLSSGVRPTLCLPRPREGFAKTRAHCNCKRPGREGCVHGNLLIKRAAGLGDSAALAGTRGRYDRVSKNAAFQSAYRVSSLSGKSTVRRRTERQCQSLDGPRCRCPC